MTNLIVRSSHLHVHLYVNFVITSLVIWCCHAADQSTQFHIVTIIEEADSELVTIINEALSDTSLPEKNGLNIVHSAIIFQEGGEFSAYLQVCEHLANGISVLLDLTWEGWVHAKTMADSLRLPYIHMDVTIQQFVHATDDFLRYRNATDAALVFPTEIYLDQGLLYLVGNTVIRIIVLNGLKGNATDNLRQMKPIPTQFVMYGTTEQLSLLIEKVNKSHLLERDSRWTISLLVNISLNYRTEITTSNEAIKTILTPVAHTGDAFETNPVKFDPLVEEKMSMGDFGDVSAKVEVAEAFISLIKPSESVCCSIQEKVHVNSNVSQGGNTEECSCGSQKINDLFIKMAFQSLGQAFINLFNEQKTVIMMTTNCTNFTEAASKTAAVNEMRPTFEKFLTAVLENTPYIAFNDSKMRWNIDMDVHILNSSGNHLIGDWTAERGFENHAGAVDELIRRFFRVGTNIDIPFVYEKRDSRGEVMKNARGEVMLEGFCIDLLDRLSEEMKFDYQIRIPDDKKFGAKYENMTWDGLIGDLVNGDTDMIVAPLTITSEREEAIDFVAPYFEQSGISIVMRKPEKTTSLFKFMSVLKEEVWWCILAALIVTALVLWLVDKYSPYSGRNKELYPYKCREFTLTECFWFALTSMTPQGGGEPPKAVSGRILVAAYWIFVVLMLATFTANLAAFLTVERMQSPVNSMEELAKQSKINYSVVNGTSVHDYFTNMALAEEELYRVWKDMTLNSSNDQSKFRVWDYPIKEQYSRILNVITGTGLMITAEEGFRKVNEDVSNKFAFIHDASIIRYEVYHNCNLTEVGEPFAEQPYAIAVQSGSHLQDEIGKHLLELQKDRYFETLSQKYWNSSLRKDCPNNDDSEGITLASIGGVFIATLVGLVIGMITLAGEVFFYRRQNKSKVVAIKIRPTIAMSEKK